MSHFGFPAKAALERAEPGLNCEWCWDDRKEDVPATVVVSGCALCDKCAASHAKPGTTAHAREQVQEAKKEMAKPISKVAAMPVIPKSVPAKVPHRKDGNDYTPLTDEQIDRIRTLKGEGYTVRQIAKIIKAKDWRVQQAADVEKTTSPAKINRTDKNPYDKTHIRADAITHAPVMSLKAYTEKYGEIGKKLMAPNTLALWRRIESLPMDSVLILPMKKNETTNAARARYGNIIYRCMRYFKPSFKIRMVGVQQHQHVVLRKVKV